MPLIIKLCRRKINYFKTLFFLSAVYCAILEPACAETSSPTVGITSGPISAIAVSSDNQDSVYVATAVGIFKSVYGRDIWTPVNEGLKSTYVHDMVLDPVTTTIMYSATEEGLYYSADGAAKWLSKGLNTSKIYSLAIHPVSNTYLAAGTTEGIFSSIDSGSNWSSEPAGPSDVYAVAMDPVEPKTLYAGSFGDGIYRSTDFGATWSKTGSGSDYVYCLAINPSTTNILYAGTNLGIFKSTDNGTSWSSINSDLSGVSVYSIAISFSSPSTVYAATDKGAYKTTDGGTTWSCINSGIDSAAAQGPFTREIVIDPADSSVVFAGTYSGDTNDVDIYKSINSGSSWLQINRELSNTIVYGLVFDINDPDIIYAGTSTIGILKSSNRGLSWKEANNGLTKYLIKDIDISPDSSNVYAGTTSGLFISSDAADEWTESSPNYEIFSIGTDPHVTENVYIGTNWGIFLSMDEAATWSSLNNNLINPSVFNIVFHPDESETIFVGTNGDGIFKSTSGGESWVAINNGLDYLQILSLAIDSTDPDSLYAGTKGGGISRTSDGGKRWETASSSLEGLTVNSIVVSPDDPDIVYAGMELKGFYRSSDNGQTWKTGSADISDKTVYDIVLDPEDSQTVFVATEGAISSFTFNTAPEAASLPSPSDGAVSQPVTTTLSWTGSDPDAGDALSYTVYFGTSETPSFNEPVAVANAEYDPGILDLNQKYYWQVNTVDSHDAEAAGGIWRFTTAISNSPLKPSNPSPPDGSEDQPLPIILTWTSGDTDNDDIVTYDIYFGVQNPPPLAKEDVLETTYQPGSLLLPYSTYYWKIVARDNNGLETAGDLWSFKAGLPQLCYLETVLAGEEKTLHALRKFRDNFLMTTESGRKLVRIYYYLSPVLLTAIQKEPELKKETLRLINKIMPHIEKAVENNIFVLPPELIKRGSALFYHVLNSCHNKKLLVKKQEG